MVRFRKSVASGPTASELGGLGEYGRAVRRDGERAPQVEYRPGSLQVDGHAVHRQRNVGGIVQPDRAGVERGTAAEEHRIG